MKNRCPVILIVDDTPLIQVLLTKFLDGCGYTLEFANNGTEAWEKLSATPDKYDAVLLDRMMPELDGMEVLRRVKQDPKLRLLPVILQTALSSPEHIAEGINAGAYYYLTKPAKKQTVQAVVASAIRDRLAHLSEQEEEEYRRMALGCLDEARFSFRTTDSVCQIAGLVSSLCPAPEAARAGIMELMMNAIEHGNLGITYAEKSHLIETGKLSDEINSRLASPEYSERTATLKFSRSENKIVVTIQDEGNGFNWEPYLDISPERIMDNHGRGIAISRKLAFTDLQYQGNGNCVRATIDGNG